MAITPEVLLIDGNYLKKYTWLNQSVDDNLLMPAITLSQDKWVQPITGDALMSVIKAGSLTTPYQALLDDYIRRAVCWYALVEAIPSLTYKYDNGSLVQRTSEDTQTIGPDVMNSLIDQARNNAQYYLTRLQDYLCANSATFPEFGSNEWPQRSPIQNTAQANNFGFSSGATAMSRTRPDKLLRQLP